MRTKVVLCAEYQGEGASTGTTTGFQSAIDHLIEQAGIENQIELIIVCIGTTTARYPHPRYSNVRFLQYAPRLTTHEMTPYVSKEALPFLVDLVPWHPKIVSDVVAERPDVVHTFQTIGSTDLAGLTAARRLRRMGHPVRIVGTVMTEIETYVLTYFSAVMDEVIDFAKAHSFSAELNAAWRLEGVFRRPSIAFRLFNVLEHFINYPLCRLYASIEYKHRAWPRAFLGRCIRRQISKYLRRVDAVTVSRASDVAKYRIKPEKVWLMPLSADARRFQPENVHPVDFRETCEQLQQSGHISLEAHGELMRFLSWLTDDPKSFVIITVGRLNNEKNVWLLSQAFERLYRGNQTKNAYWLACGTGTWSDELKSRFSDRIALPGLVPNGLLPSLLNLARSRHCFFVSASDSETYGITHEEAQRCGVPLIAMDLGTRGHFCFHDEEQATPPRSRFRPRTPDLKDNQSHTQRRPLTRALNGFCIPDFTGGIGLNAVRHSADRSAVSQAVDALTDALVEASLIPHEKYRWMSRRSIKHSSRTRLDWPTIWNLLRQAIYRDDRAEYDAVLKKFSATSEEQIPELEEVQFDPV